MSLWEDRPFTPADVAVTAGLGVLAGLLFGYGFFVLGVLVIGVSPDVAYQTCGIITSGVSVVVWKFLWNEFYRPNAVENGS